MIAVAIGPMVCGRPVVGAPGKVPMRTSPALSLLAALAFAPAACAQTLAPSGATAPYAAAALAGLRPGDGAAPIRLSASAEPFGGPSKSDYPGDSVYGPRDGGPKTAIDYRVAPDGVFGSVGYICLSDDSHIAAQDVGAFAGSQDGRLVGATVRYGFW